MAPTCFGPFGPPSGSIRQNLAKVTVFVEIISKNTSLKLVLCSGNMCCVYWVLCGVWRQPGGDKPHSNPETHHRLKHILPLHSTKLVYFY
jgi:hypothetical protein